MNTSLIKKSLFRLPKLFLGFLVIAFGTVLTIESNLGMNPWGTFHQGVSLNTNVTFGVVSQVTGIVIILFSLVLRIYPGIGTILNMFLSASSSML